eukprot:TRINITY_DN3293_c0_g1_i2.p1 TRINITY_DN3293_c0_g1~~TRINITY_DN3293_c0_g1_i2.p1  ORF type:complete len:154 (+),score=5.68 TRINITY_DN3293_c0_g1_i2:29-463(+)
MGVELSLISKAMAAMGNQTSLEANDLAGKAWVGAVFVNESCMGYHFDLRADGTCRVIDISGGDILEMNPPPCVRCTDGRWAVEGDKLVVRGAFQHKQPPDHANRNTCNWSAQPTVSRDKTVQWDISSLQERRFPADEFRWPGDT